MEGDLRWCCGSSSCNDWDLHAVVRLASSCSGGSRVTSPRAASDESFSCLPPLPTPQPHSHKDDEVTTDAAALQQLPIGPAVDDDFCLQQAFFATPPLLPRNEAPPGQQPPAKLRSKRRKKKSQVSKKEVMRVPLGGASPADPWAWRKYGQKPIKGSPYPRGYYRCSTDKDCRARKQVERCRTDPSTLIVSYTGGEHSHPVPLHRNALAGTTRNRPQPTSSSSISPAAEQPPAASPMIDTTTPLLCPSSVGVGVEYDEEVLLEDGEMEEGEEDVLSLFLKPVPSPSNGSGCYHSKDVDVILLPELHRPAPGADSAARGSEKVSKLHELTLPATTSSSRTDDDSGAAPAAMNVADEKCPFSGGLAPWEAAAVAAATNWG